MGISTFIQIATVEYGNRMASPTSTRSGDATVASNPGDGGTPQGLDDVTIGWVLMGAMIVNAAFSVIGLVR